MSDTAKPPEERPKARRDPRDAGSWAVGRNILRVSDVPEGAVNLNVDGRRVIGALQGFGQLCQKTYTLRLEGADVTPEEVVALWKREFPDFHPPESRFYPSLDGVEPGEIMLINASVQGMPVYTGVTVVQIQSRARATRSTRSVSACSAPPRRRRSGATSSPPWRNVSGCKGGYGWRRPALTRSCNGTGPETSGTTRASDRYCTRWSHRPAS